MQEREDLNSLVLWFSWTLVKDCGPWWRVGGVNGLGWWAWCCAQGFFEGGGPLTLVPGARQLLLVFLRNPHALSRGAQFVQSF